MGAPVLPPPSLQLGGNIDVPAISKADIAAHEATMNFRLDLHLSEICFGTDQPMPFLSCACLQALPPAPTYCTIHMAPNARPICRALLLSVRRYATDHQADGARATGDFRWTRLSGGHS